MEKNKSDNLMLMVRYAHKETFDYAVISTKNNRFQVVRDKVPLLRGERQRRGCIADYHVEASCNTSWLLISCAKFYNNPFDLLWNPTTDERKHFYSFSAARPIMTEVWAYGIGPEPYPSSPYNSYKLIRCRLEEGYSSTETIYAEVLSIGNGLCKEIPFPFQNSFLEPIRGQSLYLNGFYYWLVSGIHYLAIMSFDFANDEFSDTLIPMPEIPRLKYDHSSFVSFRFDVVVIAEFNGSLALVVDDFDPGENKVLNFEIWVWDGNKGSWARVSRFDVPAAASVRRVVGLYKNDKVLLEDTKGDLLLYNCETLEWENLGINDDSKSLLVYPYVEATRSWADVVRQKQ